MLSKYFAIGFLVQFFVFSTLLGKDVNAQLSAPISKNLEDVTVGEVLNILSESAHISFVFDAKDIDMNKSISLSGKNKNAAELLENFSKGLNLSYKKIGNTITLKKKLTNKVITALSGIVTPSKFKVEQPTRVMGQFLEAFTVSGKVTDSTGSPLVGVTVQVKGTSKGTVTNTDGYYEIVTDEDATLVFSYVGYLDKEVEVDGKESLNVILTSLAHGLNELIVVGYGSTTRKSLVTSVSEINTDEFAELPVPNITQSIAGRAPGVIVQSGSGLNAKASISIRGGGEPLYVIDGIIRSGNDFANLNSEDIKSINILKDASSTAVYGARAAYGIVQVTTKSGESGKMNVDYSFGQNWGQPSFWAKRVSSYKNAKLVNEARESEGLSPQYSEEELEKYKTGSDPGQYPNTDWRAAVLKNWAPSSKHNVSVSGGSDVNSYYTSLGVTNMNSLFKSGRYHDQRINFLLSNSTDFKETGIKMTGQMSGFIESSNDIYTSEGAGHDYIIQEVGMKAPYENAFNKYGLPYDVANNPAADASKDAGYMKSKSYILNGLLKIQWDVPWVEGLSLKATGNYNWYNRRDKNFRKDAAKYSWDSKKPLFAAKPQLGLSNTQGRKWTVQYFGDYNKEFGNHSISALVGYEAAYQKENNQGLNRYQYEIAIDQVDLGPTENMDNSGWERENGRAGYIAQLKYGYKSKYYIEGALRYDGSDLFPSDHRWGSFYSVSGGWIVTDEKFTDALTSKGIIDLFKLRASYGQVGMDQGIDRFSYLDLYDFNASGYVFDGKMTPTLFEGPTPSVNITWFQDNQYGVGFDFEAMHNRLYGSFDYFLFVTTGYMADIDPEKVGYIDPYGRDLPQVESDGEKRRAGYEFQVGFRDKIGEVKFDIGINLTKYDIFWNLYPFESLDTRKNPYTRQSGQYEHFSQVGYHYVKTAQSAQDWMNYAQRSGSNNLTGGDYIYEDFNGDGRLTGDDQRRIGYSSKPLINYGIPLNVSFRGIELHLLFQGAGKRDLPISRTMWDYNYLSRYDYQLDYWSPSNKNGIFPRLVSNQSVNGNNNMMPSEAWTFNGSYFRLKSVVLGYNLKYSLLKNMDWLKTCRIALTGSNLFTVSQATKFGIDPEVQNTLSSYPIERVIGVNLNIGF